MLAGDGSGGLQCCGRDGACSLCDTTTSDLSKVGIEKWYSGVITGEYEWLAYFESNRIIWDGVLIEAFSASPGDSITYYEKGIYAYHRWPHDVVDMSYKLIKTQIDPNQSQPTVTIVTI